jgi:UPF0755 protein
MWKNIASNFLTVAILIMIAAGGAIAWGKNQYTGPGPLVDAICFRVERGTTFRTAAENLLAEGAISSGYIFRVGADYEDKTAQLKAGSFLIEPNSSMREIADVITSSGQSTCGTEVNFRIGIAGADIVVRELDPATNSYHELVKFDSASADVPAEYSDRANKPDTRFRITLAEGATSWLIVDALKRAEFLAGDVETVPPEGMLAPDSYEVTRGVLRAELLAEMQRRQQATLDELWPGRDEGLPYDTPEEALIMASIVEKETGIASERPLVASVFVNRLRQGMKLQTDPTVIYGLTKGQGILGRGLRQSELRGRTPYNTYVIDGLPPTPIANPGRESIAAVLHPETSDFIFFVADATGGHVFAKTLAEHNENVAKWRAIEAERQNSSN